MSGQTSWPTMELVKTPSKLYCATCTRRQSRRAGPSSATSGASSSRQKDGDGRTSLLHPRNGEKRQALEAWCRCWRARTSWRAMEDTGLATRVADMQATSDGIGGLRWMRGAPGDDTADAGEAPVSLPGSGSFVWCCRCGARAAKFTKKLGEPCVGQPRSQESARSMCLLSSGWHPKENRFLGMGKVAAKLPTGDHLFVISATCSCCCLVLMRVTVTTRFSVMCTALCSDNCLAQGKPVSLHFKWPCCVSGDEKGISLRLSLWSSYLLDFVVRNDPSKW